MQGISCFNNHCIKDIITNNVERRGLICVSDKDALNDVYKEIADLIGYDNAMILYTHFKGQQITFPVKLFKSEHIRGILKKQYDGKNAKQLARTYGYSERWIKELVKRG